MISDIIENNTMSVVRDDISVNDQSVNIPEVDEKQEKNDITTDETKNVDISENPIIQQPDITNMEKEPDNITDNHVESGNNKVQDSCVNGKETGGGNEPNKKDRLSVLFDFCMLNYIPIILLNVVIYLISENYLKGVLTISATYLIIYLFHYAIHMTDYFKSTSNIYVNIIYGIWYLLICRLHMDHHNVLPTLFVNLKELLCEINWFLLAYLIITITDTYFKTGLIDNWIFLFSGIIYISSHHINYGWLKVNEIHSTHHTHLLTNFGPSVFDLLFDTHNKLNPLESMTNLIPNMIIITSVVLGMKWAWKNSKYNAILKRMLTIFLVLVVLLNICW